MLDPSTSSQSQLTVRPFNRSGACHHVLMAEDEPSGGSFEDTLREIARELGRSVERAVDNIDVDEFAQMFGVDASAAKDWVESAGSWLRSQAERVDAKHLRELVYIDVVHCTFDGASQLARDLA